MTDDQDRKVREILDAADDALRPGQWEELIEDKVSDLCYDVDSGEYREDEIKRVLSLPRGKQVVWLLRKGKDADRMIDSIYDVNTP
jgi:hypothetical protein